MGSIYSIINFHDDLKLKYKDYLKPEIEIVEWRFKKEAIRRMNLGFVADSDEEKLYFDPKDKIENNVQKFINEFTPYSIINTTEIFHEESCERINNKYNTIWNR